MEKAGGLGSSFCVPGHQGDEGTFDLTIASGGIPCRGPSSSRRQPARSAESFSRTGLPGAGNPTANRRYRHQQEDHHDHLHHHGAHRTVDASPGSRGQHRLSSSTEPPC